MKWYSRLFCLQMALSRSISLLLMTWLIRLGAQSIENWERRLEGKQFCKIFKITRTCFYRHFYQLFIFSKTTTRPQTTTPTSNNIELLSDAQREGSFLAKSQKIRMDASSSSDEKTTSRKKGLEAITVAYEPKSTTKDIFPLPLFTTTTAPSFDSSKLNNNFGGIDQLTAQPSSTITSTTEPSTTTTVSTTTSSVPTTTAAKKMEKLKNANHESFK